jgi:hypothetical protein
MSTKYLGRSVIELGRSGYQKFERRQVAKYNRRKQGDEPITRKPYSYRELRDHLNPMYRWIEANVDRPWSEVYSEFKQKMDTRTLQGRHIFGHFQQAIRGSGGQESSGPFGGRYYDYRIDENNILRKNPKRVYERWPYKQDAAVEKWLDGRRVTREDGAWFWVKTYWIEQERRNWQNKPTGKFESILDIRRSKTAGRMSNADVTYWESLDYRVRKKYTFAPEVK